MGGNIGNSAAEIAFRYKNKIKDIPEWIIMELSSYQIESCQEISPSIGIWTTLTPDHLERHKTLENYSNIKKSLIDKSSLRIYNADDNYILSQYETLLPGIWISTKERKGMNDIVDFWINKEGIVMEKDKELFSSSINPIPGIHNLRNLLMVTAAARRIGISSRGIKNAASNFKGVEHRLEILREIKNIKIFNDSKATNYDSSAAGIISVPAPTIVIAGGKSKLGDAKEWLRQLNKKCCGIVLYGTSANILKKIILSSGFNKDIFIHQELKEATEKAISIGLKVKASSILFSPACASFDQYRNFEERGDHFKKLIELYSSKDYLSR